MIKKKSLIVALVSSFVIAYVLILTLIGYIAYIEIRSRELKRQYQHNLRKVNSRIYSKHIDISGLNAKIETEGPLKNKPVIEGVIKNNGSRDISYLLLKVYFLDQDGAVIYEAIIHPQEPSLGGPRLTQAIPVSYLYELPGSVLARGNSLPFKKILSDFPIEILSELQSGTGLAEGYGWWSGRLNYEVIAIEF
ncbi:MAG: FxLYD domain-containing protein [Candidatus Omnitrophota bacterium]|nr:FxLYD domain-containing protein [Candidatus Omnitrophota bacterium]